MVESVGKKLHQARLQRGLTIDEAAHATKLRPDKIAALETDDYSRFANNIYAKGFLQIYGRFLKVDVEEFARTLDNSNPISISDYQYLSNAPATKSETIAVRRSDERRPPSIAPLIVFILFVGMVIGGAWLYQNYERLNASGVTQTPADPNSDAPKPTPNPDAAFITDPPPPKIVPPKPQAATPAATPSLIPATPGTMPRIASAATPGPGVPVVGATPVPKSEQDFVIPAPVVNQDSPARAPGMNEVLVATVKKTWVTVRKDDPKAPPIFEDYVYPDALPLKLKGARFFIEAKDPSVVQITKNGLPYAYQPNGAPVQ